MDSFKKIYYYMVLVCLLILLCDYQRILFDEMMMNETAFD
jgi:hypothetical protein